MLCSPTNRLIRDNLTLNSKKPGNDRAFFNLFIALRCLGNLYSQRVSLSDPLEHRKLPLGLL